MIRLLGLMLLLIGCAPAAAPSAQAPAPTGPALWRVADEDTTIWLFGTIHLLPADFAWRDATIDRVIVRSDELVLETAADSAELPMQLLQLGRSPGLPPIAERVNEDQRPRLAAMIARSPFPETFLDGLESWAAALMLAGVAFDDLGLAADAGAEEVLEQAFREAGKPIGGLETPAEQFGHLDRLPEDAQRQFLSSVIETPESMREEFAAMLDAWAAGDEAAIAVTFDEELEQSAALREALIVRRNRAWAAWIDERLDAPGEVMVAVGAGHLVGRDSVQAFLRNRGIGSRRVR